MTQIGTKLRVATGGNGVKMLMHWCPGCDEPHGIRINGSPPTWTFDGNYDAPTFAPSVRFTTYNDDGGDPLPGNQRRTLCHYFICSGIIEFCPDSPHKYAGQSVALPDWPYGDGEYGGLDDE